jgi:protein-disulfide isomerase
VIRIACGIVAAAALAFTPQAAFAKLVHKAAAKTDWSHRYSVTPDGGFRMGNPNAKVAIVEYGSLTCPHCRHFAETAIKPLVAQYVRTGKASYEFRSLILNGIDVAANLVARCDGPAHFFPMADDLYATQPMWLGRINDEQLQKLGSLPQGEMMLAIAKQTGLITIGAAHGIAPAKAEACLKSQSAAERLAAMAQSANDRGVTGTPTFFVNGKRADAYDWATLEPFLKQAGG